MAASNHIVAAIQGAGNTMTSAWASELIYLLYQRKQASYVVHQNSERCVHFIIQGGGPRVVVSTAAFHARVRGSVPGLGGLKEKKSFFPIHVWNSVFWGTSVTERYRARHQTARARISNPVSGGQCRLIHLTILRKFSWPSLAYIGGPKPDSFQFILSYKRAILHKDTFTYALSY